MRKILFILLLAPFALKSQTVNTFRDSTWFKRGVRFDSTLVFSKGAGVGKVWTSNANGTGSWQTFSSAGVTQGALDDSISAVRNIRKADTVYKKSTNRDLTYYKINGVEYSFKDSSGVSLSELNDSIASIYNYISNSVYIQADSSEAISYDVLNSQNAPPVSPATGDTYLVGNNPSGAWVGHAKDIAEWNGSAWVFTDGVQGDFLYNATTALTYIFRSGNWVQTTGIPALNKGNTISTGLTIGTRNNKDFNFISNNILRGGMLANGSFRVANQGGSGNVLVGANSLGVQRKLYIGDGLSLSNDSLLASGGGGSPAGSDTQIQYNNGGAFGADAGFTRDVAGGSTTILNTTDLGGGETIDGGITTTGGITTIEQFYSASAVPLFGARLRIDGTENAVNLITENNISGETNGFYAKGGMTVVGNSFGGNGTKITIDDVNEQITISNLPASGAADTFVNVSNSAGQLSKVGKSAFLDGICGGGSYIPLSGTEVGKPVTGNIEIEFDADRSITAHSADYSYSSDISYSAGSLGLGATYPSSYASININSLGDGNVLINSSNVGIRGEGDFTPYIDSLDYTQKIYVDQRIADTANVIRGLIPDVSNFITSSTLTDSLEKKTNKLISFNTYTTSDTLRLSDADKVIEMNVGTANNLVIPTNTAYAFPVGTQITVIQIGSGQTTFSPASGVTVHSASSKVKLSGQYSGATLIKKATNEWYLFGDITN